MKSFLALTLALLCTNLYGSIAFQTAIDSNSIQLNITNKVLSYKGSITSDGISHTNKEELVFDLSKMSIIITGLPANDRINFKIYERVAGGDDAKNDVLVDLDITNADKTLITTKISKVRRTSSHLYL
jgi:hypothetical protein